VLAPSLFVFVDVHHFHDRIRPNTVIVNNTTIISRTRVINDIRRDDREFDGSRRRVVVNEGPKADFIARSTGRSFTPKPIRDVVRETPVPERIRRTGTIERPVLNSKILGTAATPEIGSSAIVRPKTGSASSQSRRRAVSSSNGPSRFGQTNGQPPRLPNGVNKSGQINALNSQNQTSAQRCQH